MRIMKKITFTSVFLLFAFVSSLFANEVNIFSARHYDSDVQLYEKFTAKRALVILSLITKFKFLPQNKHYFFKRQTKS